VKKELGKKTPSPGGGKKNPSQGKGVENIQPKKKKTAQGRGRHANHTSLPESPEGGRRRNAKRIGFA